MAIFQIIAGLINLALMFLFFLMPIWLPALVLKLRYKKNSELMNIPAKENLNLLKSIYQKNGIVWINSGVALILIYVGFKLIVHGGCQEMGCLAMPLLLGPLVLSAIVIGIILVITLISSITQFYFPNQKKFIIPKYLKVIAVILLIIFIFYNPLRLLMLHLFS